MIADLRFGVGCALHYNDREMTRRGKMYRECKPSQRARDDIDLCFRTIRLSVGRNLTLVLLRRADTTWKQQEVGEGGGEKNRAWVSIWSCSRRQSKLVRHSGARSLVRPLGLTRGPYLKAGIFHEISHRLLLQSCSTRLQSSLQHLGCQRPALMPHLLIVPPSMGGRQRISKRA